jgi:hypothetical protein
VIERSPGVFATGRVDLGRLAEQEPQDVQVMHAHVGEREPIVLLEKHLPVRDGMQVDLCEDDRAQTTAIQNLLEQS